MQWRQPAQRRGAAPAHSAEKHEIEGAPDWTPRELRHTFVSLLSDSGVPIEQIAAAVGHSSIRTIEVVYRHQLRPVTSAAAIALGPLFDSKGTSNGGES